VDLPKFLRAFLLLHALPSSLGAVATVQLQTVATTDLDFQSIRSVVQLESERKTPSLAHQLSTVKHKGPDPSFQQQKKHSRSSAPAPEAPSGSSDYKGKGKGKTRRAFRGGKKNKQQHFHSHIADATLINIPPTIVSQPSHAGPMTTTIASFGKGSISYRKVDVDPPVNPIPSKSIFPTVQTAHNNCSDLEIPKTTRNLVTFEKLAVSRATSSKATLDTAEEDTLPWGSESEPEDCGWNDGEEDIDMQIADAAGLHDERHVPSSNMLASMIMMHSPQCSHE